MEAVMTIEQFQSMLRQEKKDELSAVLERIVQIAKPADVRLYQKIYKYGTRGGWLGWP